MVDLSKFISNKKIFSNGLVLGLLQLILQLNFVLFIFIFIFIYYEIFFKTFYCLCLLSFNICFMYQIYTSSLLQCIDYIVV